MKIIRIQPEFHPALCYLIQCKDCPVSVHGLECHSKLEEYIKKNGLTIVIESDARGGVLSSGLNILQEV